MSGQGQFDERFRMPPPQAADLGARKRARFVAEQQGALQTGLARRPANISWFERAIEGPPADLAAPILGTFCQMMPVEIAHALGARTLRLDCGNAALVQPGEEMLSGEVCPLAKASFGAALDPEGLPARAAAFVLPAACDAKRKLAEVMSDIRPTFVLALPPEQDFSRYGRWMQAEMERLTAFLEGALGRRLDRRRLLEEIELGRRRTAVVRRLQAARAANPGAMSVRDFHLVIQASFAGSDLGEWLAQAALVLEEAEAFRPERPRVRPRLVLTGAPAIWPNFKALNLIEECGADVVADTLCSGAQSCFDPVVMDEKDLGSLHRALAMRYVFASPCPCFVSQGARIARVLDLVKDFAADGVINYSLRLCQPFDVELYRLSRVMKSRRIPFTSMRTDYSLEDTEQLRVRLEAFLETIEEER